MSPREALVAGIAARLKERLPGCAVFDCPPVRGGPPHAVVEEPVLGDWSGTTWEGRQGGITVTLVDAGERPVRVRALLAAVEEAVETMPGALAGGWRLLTSRLVRGRLRQGGDGRWVAGAEFRIRMFRLNA